MAKLLVHLTCGTENPTKAALAFLVAKTAQDEGHLVTRFLAGDAVPLMRGAVLDNLSGLGTGKLRDPRLGSTVAVTDVQTTHALSFARDMVKDNGGDLYKTINESQFLRGFQDFVQLGFREPSLLQDELVDALLGDDQLERPGVIGHILGEAWDVGLDPLPAPRAWLEPGAHPEIAVGHLVQGGPQVGAAQRRGQVPSGDSFHRWSFEGRPG